MMYQSIISLAILCLTLFSSFSSQAHTRSQSFSQWQIDNERVSINFNILSREVTRLAADASVDVRKNLDQILIEHLAGKIQATIDGGACEITQPLHSLPASKGYTRLEAQMNCPTGKVFQLSMAGFFDVVPSHLHYARVIRASGEANEMVLSDAARTQTVNLEDTSKDYWQIAQTYIELGIEHILIGYDHLIFLLALLLLCRGISQALILITGFTLGHSITLSLSVLGWVEPNMVIIEALIGFSIALVALEKIQSDLSKAQALKLVGFVAMTMLLLIAAKLIFGLGLARISLIGITLLGCSYLLLVKDSSLEAVKDSSLVLAKGSGTGSTQFLLTTAFGFIHGFGFADVLREIGLPPTELGLALFTFNIGVELGQLLSLALMATMLFVINKFFSEKVQQIATTSIVALVLASGSYWFIYRSIG